MTSGLLTAGVAELSAEGVGLMTGIAVDVGGSGVEVGDVLHDGQQPLKTRNAIRSKTTTHLKGFRRCVKNARLQGKTGLISV